jgi:tetrahydromethanopterin S-methyltransferase subunit C
MKATMIVLIVAGIAGLIFSAVFPIIIGVPGALGSIAVLLTGLGFLIHFCTCRRR